MLTICNQHCHVQWTVATHGAEIVRTIPVLPAFDCLCVAIATPVTAGLRPDEVRLVSRARTLLAQGCDGIAVFGTTGEGALFPVEDRMSGLEALLGAGIAPERLIVSAGAMSIPDSVRLARHATERGVHGVLLMPHAISRGGITEEGCFRFFAAVIERIARPDLRLYLYHFPEICGVPVTPGVIRRLDERYPGQIAGVKDSGGDIDYTEMLVRRFSHLSIFTGSEIHLPEVLAAGGRGTICGLANVMPRLMRAMMDRDTAFERRKLVPLILSGDAILSRRPFIPSAKAVISAIENDPEWWRVLPPMTEVPLLERQRIITDFLRWDANLPPGLGSIAPQAEQNNVVGIRRA
jgi:4-hydroxy-tetrahydrodipicolinate synthase